MSTDNLTQATGPGEIIMLSPNNSDGHPPAGARENELELT
jgi:hypothetical protein